jgi:hypothetical protein
VKKPVSSDALIRGVEVFSFLVMAKEDTFRIVDTINGPDLLRFFVGPCENSCFFDKMTEGSIIGVRFLCPSDLMTAMGL